MLKQKNLGYAISEMYSLLKVNTNKCFYLYCGKTTIVEKNGVEMIYS